MREQRGSASVARRATFSCLAICNAHCSYLPCQGKRERDWKLFVGFTCLLSVTDIHVFTFSCCKPVRLPFLTANRPGNRGQLRRIGWAILLGHQPLRAISMPLPHILTQIGSLGNLRSWFSCRSEKGGQVPPQLLIFKIEVNEELLISYFFIQIMSNEICNWER